MCNKNYQGFIESVSELHKVKSDALKLKVHCVQFEIIFHVYEDTIVRYRFWSGLEFHVEVELFWYSFHKCVTIQSCMTLGYLYHRHTQRKIIEANSVIQDSGEKLVQSAVDLHRSRQIHVNLMATMDTLNRCTPGMNSAFMGTEQCVIEPSCHCQSSRATYMYLAVGGLSTAQLDSFQLLN